MDKPISLAEFREQGRRVCFLMILIGGKTGCGAEADDEASACHYRRDGVRFTDSHCSVDIYGECTHPDRSQRLSLFCPPMIHRIEKEAN